MRNDMEIKLTKPQKWLLLVVVLGFTVCITSMLADLVNGAQAHDHISRYALTGLLHGGLSMQVLLIWIFFTNLGGGGRGRGRRSSSLMPSSTKTPTNPRTAVVNGKCQFIK